MVPTSSLQADFTVFIQICNGLHVGACGNGMYDKALRVCISGLSIPCQVRVDVYGALILKADFNTFTPGKTRSSAFTMVSLVEVNS